ncbi:MAG TPA: septum formation initiator family protein [Thermoleophilaceae bacterium]|nr:septum formation initiator family protein [Thermoleophilaceae bacterium]
MAASATARRPPAAGRIRWDRLGRYALLMVLFAILLAYISPVSHWIRQSETAKHEEALLHELQDENDHLKARVDDLKRPLALEREARKLGMIKEGERAYVIENLP